ncbi:uL15 family ribosomal protein [Candidatus Woesearchaeota archaeon]|nr:uL15 family ribosomal protein [Candidatus Woesearchaeota archaeon]
MVHNKRSKLSRARGSWTHGGGEKKKRRGAGHRGGRGKAGSGKKGDAKKTMYWKDTKYFGKYGFHPINQKTTTTINISDLELQKDKLLNNGQATKTGDTIKLDLTALKYTKLLGAGKTKTKYEITVLEASKIAIKKIEEAGGKINLPNA